MARYSTTTTYAPEQVVGPIIETLHLANMGTPNPDTEPYTDGTVELHIA